MLSHSKRSINKPKTNPSPKMARKRLLSSVISSVSDSSPHSQSLLLVVSAASSALATLFILLLLFLCLYFSLRRRRSPTLPFDYPNPPPVLLLLRFPFRLLRSATNSFHPSRLLGRGASASVFLGLLPDGKSVAVKSITATNSVSSHPTPTFLEFKNELSVLSSIPPSPFVVSLLGYCTSNSSHNLLVYEYLPNGSLQEALFGETETETTSSSVPLSWERRFQIVLDVARGLEFLHLQCEPPVVHGDIKPSNVLLGADFRAKIADFGLARVKKGDDGGVGVSEFSQDLGFFQSQELCCSVSPEFEFANAVRSNSCCGKSSSFEGRVRCNPIASLEGKEEEEEEEEEVVVVGFSGEQSKEFNGDWWWKQEDSCELSSKDYVSEWIESQICPESNPHSTILEAGDETLLVNKGIIKQEEKIDDSCSKKSGSMKEWWKEEYFVEMSKKSSNKCSKGGLNWFHGRSNNDNHVCQESSFRKARKSKKRSKSVGSELFSGDLFSRELSSTATSMRGTICYVAPEHNGCGRVMEKADIYSFGVLILVIVSGRRPLHILSSPIKLERANLVSWARQLAHSGNVLDLLDERLKEGYSKEQASLCIKLALLCIQKLPELRPDSGEIVRILKGEMDLPVVPFEFSPSPRLKRKVALDAE